MLAGQLVYKLVADARDLNRAMDRADAQGKAQGQRTGRAFGQSLNQGLQQTQIDMRSPIQRGFAQAESTVRSGSNRLGSVMKSVFTGIGVGIAGALTSAIGSAVSTGISQVTSLAKTVYNVGSAAESLKISFRTIIGDTAKADRLLADMRKFSAATPYTGTEVQNASQKLLTVVKPEDMITTLRRLGDVAAGTRSQLGDLATIYQQVLSKGKLQAEEMIQFAERGIPIQEAVAKVLKVQVSEVSELGSKGKITADVMVKAFAELADKGGKFNGIMEKQSKTLAGMASTMQDKFEQAAGTIYDKVSPALSTILSSLDKSATKAGQNSKMMDLIGEAANKVAALFVRHQVLIDKAFAATVQWVEKGMRTAIDAAGGIYNWLQKNPGIVKEIQRQTELWGKGINLVWDIAKALAPAFGAVLNVVAKILGVFNDMGEWMQKLTRQALDMASAIAKSLNLQQTPTGEFTDGGKFQISDPKRGFIKNYDQSSAHHTYQTTKRGVAKDFTLYQNGRSDVPVPSPVSGVVKQAGRIGGYGNAVIIQADDGSEVVLGHFANNLVKSKQRVVRGQALGIQGSTGNSTGTHVHIEAPEHILRNYYSSLNSGNWGRTTMSNNPENIRGFLQAIAAGETDHGNNIGVSSAGARGKYQFIPSTRSYIMSKYGQDAWGSPQQQEAAAVALIKDVSPAAYNAIVRGDFATAARLLNKTWTSLPGGAEESHYWKKRNINQYQPGGQYYRGGQGGGNPDEIHMGAEDFIEAEKIGATNNAGGDRIQQAINNRIGEEIREQIREQQEWEANAGTRKGETIQNAIAAMLERNIKKGGRIAGAIGAMNQRYAAEDAAFGARQNIGQRFLELAQARAGAITDPDKAREANIAVGRQSIELNLASQIQQIEQLGRSGLYTKEQLQEMKEQAHEISQIQIEGLNKQFLSLGDTIKGVVGQAFGTFLQSVLSGTESINSAFGKLFGNIAGQIMQMGISRLIGGIFGGGISAFANGGTVGDGGRHFKNIGSAMRWEKWATGQKPQLAVVNQGERIIPAFANGMNISGSPISSINVNVGDLHFDRADDPGKAMKIQELVKSAIYGVLAHESRQGGMLR